MGFFAQNPIFQKSDKGSKFAVECDWISKFSQNVQVLVFWKKTDRISEKNLFSSKSSKIANLQ